MVFLTLLIIPLLIALGFFVFDLKKITWQEFLIHVGAQLAVAGISIACIYSLNTSDTEIWNGHVTNKESHHVSCQHSYECHCHMVEHEECDEDSKGHEHCHEEETEHCDTCYEHRYDVDWTVHSNIGDWDIDRIDRQGLQEPPRFTQVQIGDPVVNTHTYTNYIKGAPNTLFRFTGEEANYKTVLPTYQQNVYDYYKVNRIFTVNYKLSDEDQWNLRLAQINGTVGYQKQCNIIVLFTSLPREFFYALTQHWLGGKKNDIVVVISAQGSDINWVNVMAWTDSSLFKVKLVDDIIGVKKVDKDQILGIISQDTQKYFIRKHMRDFKYLQASVTPTTTQWAISMIIGIVVSIAIGIFFIKAVE